MVAYPAYTAWDRLLWRRLVSGCRYGSGIAAWSLAVIVGTAVGMAAGMAAAIRPTSCCYPTYSCCGDTVYCCGDTVTWTPSPRHDDRSRPADSGQPTPAKKPVIEAPNAPTCRLNREHSSSASRSRSWIGTRHPGDSQPSGTPTTSVTPDNSGILTVWVPYDAKVTINGMATKSTGSRRQFVSYDLKDGFSYKYEVKAEVVRDGKIIEDTKSVVLTAGANNAVAFGFNIAPAEGLAAAK